MTDRLELGRILALVASDLGDRGYPAAGVVRQAARALLEAVPAGGDSAETLRCRQCGGDLERGSRGPPPTFCPGDKCRSAWRRRRARGFDRG